MYRLKARVVIHEDKQVLISGVMCPHKWAGDVGVDKTTGVRGLVECGVVGMTSCIRRSAGGASVETPVSECWRRIGGNGGKCAGLGWRHDVDVMVGTRSMNGVATLNVRSTVFLGLRSARHHTPFEKPPRSAERQNQTVPLGGRRRENCIYISKTALRLGSFPQSVDREQGIRKTRHTSNILECQVNIIPGFVHRNDREVSDDGATLGTAVYAHYTRSSQRLTFTRSDACG
eukprot:1923480-Pleurochrysis_carterae.AAC.1